MPGPVYDRILNVVRQIPAGKVATYGQVAISPVAALPAWWGTALRRSTPAAMYLGS